MTEEQQAAKYTSDLKYPIQECVILLNVFSVDEAHNKAIEIERLQSTSPSFRHPALIEESTSDVGVQSSPTMVNRPSAHQSTNTSASAPTTTTVAAAKSKENSYAKPGVGKCYRCGEPEHKSNKCPRRIQYHSFQ